jgi:hypothetical protein
MRWGAGFNGPGCCFRVSESAWWRRRMGWRRWRRWILTAPIGRRRDYRSGSPPPISKLVAVRQNNLPNQRRFAKEMVNALGGRTGPAPGAAPARGDAGILVAGLVAVDAELSLWLRPGDALERLRCAPPPAEACWDDCYRQASGERFRLPGFGERGPIPQAARRVDVAGPGPARACAISTMPNTSE